MVLKASNIDDWAWPSPPLNFLETRNSYPWGVAIRSARKSSDLSQEALAVDAELDRSYMGGIERGEHNPTLMNICRISAALDLKPSELLASAGL